MSRQSIKILNAALDEVEGGKIVLRGVIDCESLDLLQAGPYQREILPLAKISELVEALKTSRVPDVELGLRGGNYQEREENFYLSDPAYIIDGLQRITAARHLLREGNGHKPHLGATIHFNTDEEWERERFRVLNAERTRLSANILLRNMKENNEAINTVYNLTVHEKSFLMCGKICWAQRMQRDHLVSAPTFLRSIGVLHSRFGAGRSHNLDELAAGLQKIMERVGRNTLRDNIKSFWDLFDQCWGIRTVAYRDGAAYLRDTFLWCMGEVLGGHENFWRGNRLFVEADLMRKIKAFPLADPHVKELASSAGQARKILLQILVEHINSGKRTKRLQPRPRFTVEEVVEESQDSMATG